jgi:phosphoserine phosphatase
MKLVAFDMEGTIYGPFVDGNGHDSTSMWSELPRRMGEDAKREQEDLYESWVEGEFDSYVQFTNATVDMHMRRGLSREQFTEVINRAQLRDGAYEVFETIQQYPSRTALVTGSFKELGNVAQSKLGIDHVFASCEFFWSENGKLSHSNILPTDEKGKRRVVSAIAESYGLSSEDVIYVGDNRNDIDVVRWAGVSIGVNPPEELEYVADYSINTDKEGFSHVADIIEGEFED